MFRSSNAITVVMTMVTVASFLRMLSQVVAETDGGPNDRSVCTCRLTAHTCPTAARCPTRVTDRCTRTPPTAVWGTTRARTAGRRLRTTDGT